MNNNNYIQETETVQQKITQPHIYKITNLKNNKFYYGVHNGSNTENYWGSGTLIREAIKKYGLENFKKEILLIFDTMQEALEYEAVIVNEKMLNNPLCYNLRKGGTGGDTYSYQSTERKEEISLKQSDSHKLVWENKTDTEKEEISFKISEANKIAWKNIWENKTDVEKEEYYMNSLGSMTEQERFEASAKGVTTQLKNGTHVSQNPENGRKSVETQLKNGNHISQVNPNNMKECIEKAMSKGTHASLRTYQCKFCFRNIQIPNFNNHVKCCRENPDSHNYGKVRR